MSETSEDPHASRKGNGSGSQATQFKPKQSGNPKGRPKGSRNRSTRWLDAIVDGEAEAVIQTVLEKAKAGEPQAMKLVVERIAPRPRGRSAPIELPELERPEDVPQALNAVLQSAADGEITIDEAQGYAQLIERQRQAIADEDLHREIQALKQYLGLV